MVLAEVDPAAECEVKLQVREAVGGVREMVGCVVETPVGYVAASLVEATLTVAVAAGSSVEVHTAMVESDVACGDVVAVMLLLAAEIATRAASTAMVLAQEDSTQAASMVMVLAAVDSR